MKKIRRLRGGSEQPTTYFILTASLIQNGKEAEREQQYKQAFQALKASLAEFPTIKAKIIIVENNGKRHTFLDELGADHVVYTDSNLQPITYKGAKEIKDVQEVLRQFNIQGDDFVVKLTGRYTIQKGSPFMKALAERGPNIDAIVRYGSVFDEKPPAKKIPDATTGLIGLKAKFVSQIRFIDDIYHAVEWEWGKVIYDLPDDRVIALDRLGGEFPVDNWPVLVRGGGVTSLTHFILTASLIQNGKEAKREQQYRQAFQALKASLVEFPAIRAKIYIVENNGQRATFLDSLGADAVIYTDTNKSAEPNKGNKELSDIKEVIRQRNIEPEDFVVKVTGRYSVRKGSAFMKALAERGPNTDAIARFGSFMSETAPAGKVPDVITGLVGMKAKYISQVEPASGTTPIEWNWGKVLMSIPNERVVALQRLGAELPIADGEPILRGGSKRSRSRKRARRRATRRRPRA